MRKKQGTIHHHEENLDSSCTTTMLSSLLSDSPVVPDASLPQWSIVVNSVPLGWRLADVCTSTPELWSCMRGQSGNCKYTCKSTRGSSAQAILALVIIRLLRALLPLIFHKCTPFRKPIRSKRHPGHCSRMLILRKSP